jgi:hypothetical protein
MAINLAEVGASCSIDASGMLQIGFGLYLPGIRSTEAFDVIVRAFIPPTASIRAFRQWTWR